jgi:sugar phosphate isomerase/epimerase
MRGLKGHARACLVAVAVGSAISVAGASAGQAAERPPSTGAGVPIGQLSVQLYNWNRYLSGSTAQQQTRLREVFEFLRARGLRTIEPYTPGSGATPLFGYSAAQFKALADEYGLHVVGRHGTVRADVWDAQIADSLALDQEFIGSGNVAPGGFSYTGSYANALASAAELNRLGKRSVEAGLGKVYIHNHQGEFTTQYLVDGVMKSAWEVIMDNTDARWVAAEIDVGWSSDAGTDTIAHVNKYGSRVAMFHVKDGTNINKPGNATLVAVGTGEVDYAPILAAAKGKVKYYHYELDPPTATYDAFAPAAISLDNLRGEPAPTLYANVPRFPSHPEAGPGKEGPPQTVNVENTGDAPLTIQNTQIQASAPDTASSQDFRIVSNDCNGKTLAPAQQPKPATDTTPATPRMDGGKCTVQVAFAPKRALTHSLARLQFTSNSDVPTNQIMLSAKSGPSISAPGNASADVPAVLSLTLNSSATFGAMTPGTARDYLATSTATVTTTSGDAALTVTDTSPTDAGYLVNGAFKLASPLQIGATNAATPTLAYQPLGATPLALLNWTAPTTNNAVSIGYKQSISASETLRTGSYSKALTFTLSTTTP